MSLTGGQGFGAVIGAAIGFALAPVTGGASLAVAAPYIAAGATIGMFVGGIIDPPPPNVIKQEGSRLGDLDVQTSEWGAPIRRLFGTYKLSGNVIWSLSLKETKHVEESGEGKGGGGTETETTWYSYSGSWACGFCEGEIADVKRIWFDSVLVFDGFNYTNGLGSGNHTIYKGSSDQPIDWFMQQTNPDSTPAYRHLFYIVFMDIELENYGNKVPKVSVEASKSGTSTYTGSLIKTYTTTQHAWEAFSVQNAIDGAGAIHSINADYTNNYIDVNWKSFVTLGSYKDNLVATTVNHHTCPTTPETECDLVDNATAGVLEIKTYDPNEEYIIIGKPSSGYIIINRGYGCCNISNSPRFNPMGYTTVAGYTSGYIYKGYLYSYFKTANMISRQSCSSGAYEEISTDFYLNGGNFDYHAGYIYFLAISATPKQLYIKKIDPETFTIVEEETISLSMNMYDYTTATQAINNYVDDFGFHVFNHQSYANISHDYNIIYQDSTIINFLTIGGTPSYKHFNYVNRKIYITRQVFRQPITYYDVYNFGDIFSSNTVSVGSIVSELLLRSGLEDTDFDVFSGTDQVNGYVISNPMTTRPAISTLISAYSFDLLEVNSKLVLKKRDTTPIKTIVQDEIVDFVEITRFQTVELSRQINILYANKDNNYNVGIQSTLRNDSNTENAKTYQFPLALSDTEAKQISERLLYSEWNERIEFKFNTLSKHLDLLPSDVVTLNYEEKSYTIRITKIDYLTDNSVNIEGSLENEIIYDSTAIGSDTGSVDYIIDSSGATYLEVLDIPMLDNSVNYEGLYLAVESTSSGWNGCSIHKSIDDEASYSKVSDLLTECIIGKSITLLPNGVSHTWDYNEVTVAIEGSLESVTSEVVLTGQNYILLGDEILQYTTATDNLDDTFTLSKLLRGRRGTEWAMGTHSINDRFVFLSTNLYFDKTASLNVNAYYKATTFGSFIEDSTAEYIVPEIRCLKPLSPSYIRGYRDGSNNLIITWMRRSRDVTGYLNTLTLMEETEAYDIEITTGAGRLLTSTSETTTYTSTDQTTDGITLGDPITLTIYQMSGIVQRGYGTEVTL